MEDTLTSGTVFFMLQTSRTALDSEAEIVRTLERYGARGSDIHGLAVKASSAALELRQALATDFELRSRAERKPKRK